MSAAEQAAWLERYLEPLKGATIFGVKIKVEDGEVWPVLVVENLTLAEGETLELEISRDEEGNGPGFIFGLPVPS